MASYPIRKGFIKLHRICSLNPEDGPPTPHWYDATRIFDVSPASWEPKDKYEHWRSSWSNIGIEGDKPVYVMVTEDAEQVIDLVAEARKYKPE